MLPSSLAQVATPRASGREGPGEAIRAGFVYEELQADNKTTILSDIGDRAPHAGRAESTKAIPKSLPLSHSRDTPSGVANTHADAVGSAVGV